MDLFEQIRQREADKCKQQEIKVQQLKFVPNLPISKYRNHSKSKPNFILIKKNLVQTLFLFFLTFSGLLTKYFQQDQISN